MPAWIQAIGSLVAIAIAIWVPWSIEKAKAARIETERRAKGHAVAILIFPALTEWHRSIRRFEIAPDEYGNGAAVHLALAEISRKGGLIVPEKISDNVKDLELLEGLGERLMICVFKNFELQKVYESIGKLGPRAPMGDQNLIDAVTRFATEYEAQRLRLDDIWKAIPTRFEIP